MTVGDRERIREIRTFPQLIKFLRDDLDWPIEADDFDDVTFDYEPEELGIDSKTAAKIQEVKQLRPLVTNQPWGIFFIKFEPKRLPVVALRRILNQLVIKKRASAEKASQAVWELNDLLFISNYGEGDSRQITFAQFSQEEEAGSLPTLKVLGWDDADTALHLGDVYKTLTDNLKWPEDEGDTENWRTRWSSAFVLRHREVIDTSKKLSERLAVVAMEIRKRVNTILQIETDDGPLRKMHVAFKTALIHDLTEDGFADMYAQTITYGLLTARVSNPEETEVHGIAEMLPVTNPFLRDILATFLTVGGDKDKIDFDEVGINDVIQTLKDANMEAVLRDFGDRKPEEDPVIFFYEDFLKAYDAERKVQRGVFYTPKPVVSYIVRSVHELLQTKFGLEDGLADTATWADVKKRNKGLEYPERVKPSDAFVQILDPATGTGTFLVEVIDVIHKTVMAKWDEQGLSEQQKRKAWNEYVPKHLLPRLYGFELMMAPYAIAHMKVGLKLHETGYSFGSDERARIYLTNSLEPPSDVGRLNLFSEALAHEAEAVNEIKNNKQFIVIIGNPPYSGISQNPSQQRRSVAKGEEYFPANKKPPIVNRDGRYVLDWDATEEKVVKGVLRPVPLVKRIASEHREIEEYTWIGRLIQDYKIDEGVWFGEVKHWLDDDYVKFIRFAQWRLNQTGHGVLGFITNHGYIENPTFRGMRQSLQSEYDEIYVLDLHGSQRRGKVLPEGIQQDENVFEIQSGVAIIFLVKENGETNGCKTYYQDKWGSQNDKYDWLKSKNIDSTQWVRVFPSKPFYHFYPINTEGQDDYINAFWSLEEVFGYRNIAIQTSRDALTIHWTPDEVWEVVQQFSVLEENELRDIYSLGEDTRNWRIELAQKDIKESGPDTKYIAPILYRLFDYRSTYYTGKNGFMAWPRPEVMSHMTADPNLGLLTSRQQSTEGFRHVFICNSLADMFAMSNRSTEGNYVFPLYLYDPKTKVRTPNQNPDLYMSLGKAHKVKPMPEEILHYIYAVLYSPTYRERYSSFLKSDFPRIPFTSDLATFKKVAGLGDKLVNLHLLKNVRPVSRFEGKRGKDSLAIEKIEWKEDRLYINSDQYFTDVPIEVWEYLIGGYQVLDKWLKERKNKNKRADQSLWVTKELDEVTTFCKIIEALRQTIEIQKEIDELYTDVEKSVIPLPVDR